MDHEQLVIFIPPERQGEYFTIPFAMPENVASMTLSYHYPTHISDSNQTDLGVFHAKERLNIIDLGLFNPDGKQVGVSGSDKDTITISESSATTGYSPTPLTPGEWQILVGAYQVAPQGVTVTYEMDFISKQCQLLIGDIHTHTTASDGVLTLPELAAHAKRHDLDFLAITDHNHMAQSNILNQIEGITLIPGVEWTHYQGHANFLGVDQPYDPPFYSNTTPDALKRFALARERGALIVVNHPCDDTCPFTFNLETFPFDCIEIWNGPMRESNLKAIALWQKLLESGKQIPAVGGSDYHKDHLFQILGGPCMGVYALSNCPKDILDAIQFGHSYICFAPEGPSIQLTAAHMIMGDKLPWKEGQTVSILAKALKANDVLRVIHNQESMNIFQAPSDGDVELSYPVSSPGFVRVEIYRTFIPGLPPLPALISNPIYFTK